MNNSFSGIVLNIFPSHEVLWIVQSVKKTCFVISILLQRELEKFSLNSKVKLSLTKNMIMWYLWCSEAEVYCGS